MKKSKFASSLLVATLFLIGGVAVQAQVIDFQDNNIGDTFDGIGWSATDIVAEVADDPLSSGNNVLKCTIHNYNAAPVLVFTLPAGKTLADYESFNFKGYFAQGDVGWKDIIVEAYATAPTGQAFNNTDVRIGSWNRASGGSTAWEDITIPITGSADLTGTIYIAFGINCAGTGDIGGSGVTTIWYADDVELYTPPPPLTDAVVTWGSLGGRHGNWDITVGPNDGDASMSGDGPPTGNWATIRGALPDTLEATTTQAVVVTGQIEFTGDDLDTWGPFRYGLFHHDSAGTIQYAGTDSVCWTGKESDAYGYMFSPNSGTNDKQSGQGGNGTQWAVNGGTWLSTWSGGTMTLGDVNPAPARAIISEGVYDFAISVLDLGDGTNEIRFYMVKQDFSYWFGGTVIDTIQPTTKFNGICFGKNHGNGAEETDINGVHLTGVQAYLGDPINVPEKPWEPYYIDAWGTIGGRWGNWRLEPGEFVGDVSIYGDGPPTGNWATVRGGFLEPLEIKTDKAVIVRGSVEFVGDDLNTWGPFRYGFFYHDSVGVLAIDSSQAIAGTDTTYYNMAWTGKENYAYGYMFSPNSGTNDRQSGQGGNGTQWAVNGGTWLSTWSGGTMTMGDVNHAPARAVITEGTYDFAMSVQKLPDGSNEIRYYFQKQYTGEQTSYWIGATFVDTAAVTDIINGVCFGKNHGNGAEETDISRINLMEVEVDYGTPIDVTPKPWQAYYIDAWGTIGGRWGNWRLEPGEFVGDVSMYGDGPPSGNWATVRGGFLEPIEVTTDKAVIVRGSVEFVGDDLNTWGPIRYGFFYHDSAGVLAIDSTQAIAGTDTTYYNMAWTGKENYSYGYMFSPNSGTNDRQSGQGGNGTQWAVNGGTWLSTWSGGTMTMGDVLHAPARAVITEGTYDFAMSVQKLPDGSNEIRYYFQKQYTGEQTSYWIGASFVDPTPVTDKINGFCFGKNHGNGAEETDINRINLMEVEVDYGTPIDVTPKPWQAYFVDAWGISGDGAGWNLTPGEFVGDVTIGGAAAPTGFSAVRGQFLEPHEPTIDKALIVHGRLELVGGGFEDLASLRYGIFYSDSAGNLDSTDIGYAWNGTAGHHSGYLFVPPSGDNVASWSEVPGTWGSVTDGLWYDINGPTSYPFGSQSQDPAGGIGGAGTYDWAISIYPKVNGHEVHFVLSKTDGSYYFAGYNQVPVPAPTKVFNCVGFAISNSTTTTLELMEVEVDMDEQIVAVETEKSQLPKVYALRQNYPNPFNPTTMIEFDLPKQSDVKLVVYDIMGRTVAELASGKLNAGYHKLNFNAAHLASGVYFYKLQAGDFVSMKKMMLLK